ncbi:MAG: ABC transporter ATP-binding protein [Clostridia bacterium]|nr:ABC transporter ATP-binding protein [Clostridia bacterium]
MSLLDVKNLHVCFHTRKGLVRAVEDASFSLGEGKTLALVGESGSGKSVSAMSILRLLDGNGFIDKGEILFTHDGGTQDLAKVPMEEMYAIRGDRISVIFQEPMTALNPVFTIGRQLCEPFLIHRNMSKKEAWVAAVEMLKAVKIPNPEGVMKEYAHRLSGGMRQRVMIAMALACQPNILIADEPTTALDVTIQAQILRLMRDLQAEKGTAILFITHDLGVVREMADTVAVMYCGQVVELVPAPFIFDFCRFSHPYTEGLLLSAPSAKKTGERLQSIKGSVPSPHEMPKGCRFAPRCPYCTQKCIDQAPDLVEVEKEHRVRCFYAEKEERRSEGHQRLIVRA